MPNPYRGLNAHLQSYLQAEYMGWQSFHSDHITDLARFLDRALPSGYYTRTERGLQIREVNPQTGKAPHKPMSTVPDVGIYGQGRSSGVGAAIAPSLTLPLIETYEEDDFLMSVTIYGDEAPVTRLELLSPANKPPHAYHRVYRTRRLQSLLAGVALVELDYLHETRAHLPELPSYPDREAGAFPYSVIISTPYPSIEVGKAEIYPFFVDDPIPTVNIPLQEGEALAFDFNQVYQYTFENSRFYTQVAVNYSQPPLNMARYNQADQARIEAVMARIGGA